MNWDKIQIGDIIKVRTWNRDGYKTVKRKVVYKGNLGIGINLFGWRPFYINPRQDKIIEHYPK